MHFYFRHFFCLCKHQLDHFFYILFFVISGNINYESHLPFFLSRSMSASTIILTKLLKDTLGFQSSSFFAFVASPIKKSTSAGLKNSLDIFTYFFQLTSLIASKAHFTNCSTEWFSPVAIT